MDERIVQSLTVGTDNTVVVGVGENRMLECMRNAQRLRQEQRGGE